MDLLEVLNLIIVVIIIMAIFITFLLQLGHFIGYKQLVILVKEDSLLLMM
ncbi:hypothetical protein GCM10007111_04120 [Virgibacillus kapii]|uniref:Uncharacterized protein n=1 Tax=Virgibacillus kapii TaxID=1638645 RepID=A0ABQ2D515_9BACI|nr:hypothetical protein M948_14675 [Virgibacillus sp. CM-4]GGJ45288.1 hypothetical protein GCM10007111_04120 [Virgibacillus kapii]